MSGTARDGGGSPLSTIDWGVAASYGAGAFCLAFVTTGVFSLVNVFLSYGIGTLRLVSGWRWLVLWPASGFYSSHFGATTLSPLGLLSVDGGIPGIVFILIPIAVLVFAGYRATARHDGDATDRFAQGAATASGYGVLMLVSLPVVRMISNAPMTGFGPTVTRIVLVAGVLYPVVFGGLGGALNGSASSRRRHERDSTGGEWSTDEEVGQPTDAGGWSTDDDEVGQSSESGGWSTGEEDVGQSSESGGWSMDDDEGRQTMAEDSVGQPDPDYVTGNTPSTCGACGYEVQPGNNYCPNCGSEV